MYIIFISIGLLTFVLIALKYIWKIIEMQRLSSIYGTQNNYQSYQELNKEYYNQFNEYEIDEQVLMDVEIDKVFDKINRTYTDVGREYLYGQFFQLNRNDKLLDRLISLCENKILLKKIIYELFHLSREYSQSLELFEKVQFLNNYDVLIIWGSYLIPIIFVFLAMKYGIDILMMLFLWVGLQSLLYIHYTKKSAGIVSSGISYCYLVKTLIRLNRLHIFDNDTTQSIHVMTQRSLKYTKIYRICMMFEYVDVYYLFELIKGVFLLPIFQSYILLKHKDQMKDDYLKMYEYVGMIDLAVSICSLRIEYQTCVPCVVKDPFIMCEKVYHPILKDPVKNSFSTARSCMITGSNASGKSTFLKTIGFNFLMAKSLHTCFAEKFEYYPFCLCTSIHMKDDIGMGDSYFVKEIKTLKYMIEQSKDKKCLILIDEILRGTNEKERLMIAKALLSYLWESESLVMITTHDIMLVDYFKTIDQYCFKDYIDTNKLYCDYKIKKGICQVGNAIELLKVYGIEDSIIENINKEKVNHKIEY